MKDMQYRPRSSPRLRHLSIAVTWTLVLAFVVLAVLTPALPDYETYQAIYESGGGHLATLGRDPGFVLLVQTLEPWLGYMQFRWLILAFVAALTLISLKKLQAISPRQLGMTLALALLPLIVIKFGAQIREGVALCLWMAMVLGSARRPNPLLFIAITAVSTSIHLATAPLWILLALAYYLNPRLPRTAMLMAMLVYGVFVFVVADVSRLEEELFAGLSTETITPDLFTVLYWLIYPSIFALNLLRGETQLPPKPVAPLPHRTLAFVVTAVMTGLLLGMVTQLGLTGSAVLQKGVIADFMRLAALALTLFCIFLATRGKHLNASFLALFLGVDTVRIILAA